MTTDPCRLTTYRHCFACVAPTPQAKFDDDKDSKDDDQDSKNRGCASPVKQIFDLFSSNKKFATK